MITYIIQLQNGKTINAVGNKEKVKALKENIGAKIVGKERDDSNNPPPAPKPVVVEESVVIEELPEEPVLSEEKSEEENKD